MPKKLIKNISFRNNDAEIMLMEHANSKRNFSEWVKQKLEEDMGIAKVNAKIETSVEVISEIVIDDNMF